MRRKKSQAGAARVQVEANGVRWIGGYPRACWSKLLMLAAIGPLLASAAHATATFSFVEVAAARGILPHSDMVGMGSGAAAADFDNDGDIDIFIVNTSGTPDRLYRNLGGGQFEEIAASAGLASTNHNRAALWFDYDGDHLLDLLVALDCFQLPTTCPPETLTLYRQVSNAVFQDVTAAADLDVAIVSAVNHHIGGLSAGDINNDGYLDLFVSTWGGSGSRLFLNDGDGTFTDISSTSGILVLGDYGWQPMMHDFDGDGFIDIYQAVDFTPNRLWLNQGNDTFTDVAVAAGLANAMNDMGMTLADLDNDGDLDPYVTNIAISGWHNVLLRNDSSGSTLSFTEVSATAGVDQGYWGWGTTTLDADLDGLVDLVATNGFWAFPWFSDPSRFFRNTGGLAFSEMSSSVGFDDTDWGSSLLAFDFDRDGDQDLFQVTMDSVVRLLENLVSGSPKNFLVVKPRMPGSNHRAIGAVVRITAGGLDQTRLISAGTSFLGQEPAEAFFGLGSATTVDQLTIEWPDGTQSLFSNVSANQILGATGGLSVSIGTPSPSLSPTGPFGYTVSYSGANSVSLSISDISLSSQGTAACSASVSGTGTSQRTVTLSSCSGVGTVGFSVAPGSATGTGGESATGVGSPRAVLDTDTDMDGIGSSFDNCPSVSNPTQQDTDGDGVGDACNDADDADGDEYADALDNCPTVSNPSQVDTDGDGIGDACEVTTPGVPALGSGGIAILAALLGGTATWAQRRRQT